MTLRKMKTTHRPKLQPKPISPAKSLGDDEGLGFDDILTGGGTGKANAKDEYYDGKKPTMSASDSIFSTPASSSSSPRPLRSTMSSSSSAPPVVVTPPGAKGGGEIIAIDAAAGETAAAAARVVDVTVSQYSSITAPLAVDPLSLCTLMESDGEEVGEDAAARGEMCDDDVPTGDEDVSLRSSHDLDATVMSIDIQKYDELPSPQPVSVALTGKSGRGGETNTANATNGTGTTASITPEKSSSSAEEGDDAEESSSDSSSSMCGSNGDSESESESEASGIREMANSRETATTRLQYLKGEIRTRRKLMIKLLREREGTSYAGMIHSQEDLVNSRLLGRAGMASSAAEPTGAFLEKALFYTIRSILLDEYYHTLPGAFSLVVHCIFYISFHAIISKSMNWLCDRIACGGGWDVNTNNFDCTTNEHGFYAIALMASLVAARITGAAHDWNENRGYRKRVEFQLRNKWYLRCWDARAMNYFYGNELHEIFDDDDDDDDDNESSCSNEQWRERTARRRQKRWGPRMKYILDLCSFFVCYKCVDHFVYNMGIFPLSDVTQLVLDGLPSRQLKMPRDSYSAGTGVSYACPRVMSALDNPYSSDMLNWLSSVEFESEEVKNWVTNAKQCGWLGGAVAEGVDENDATDDGGDDDDTVNDSIGSNHPTFLVQKRITSVHDDNYLQRTVSNEAYYDLVGHPNPLFHDPTRETIFLIITTAICIGLLYAFGIPFLLI